MPYLQEHLLGVAGTASSICNNFNKPINKQLILSVSLLHDIGNIVKEHIEYNVKFYPNYFNSENTLKWERIKKEFIDKYGSNDYIATYTILKELSIPDNVYNLIQSLEFAKAPITTEGTNTELKICLYSDARVSPHGVVSLKDRLSEVKERYMRNKGISEEKFNQISESLFQIEGQIFAHCKIKPEDITDEKIEPLIISLRNFEIETK